MQIYGGTRGKRGTAYKAAAGERSLCGILQERAEKYIFLTVFVHKSREDGSFVRFFKCLSLPSALLLPSGKTCGVINNFTAERRWYVILAGASCGGNASTFLASK